MNYWQILNRKLPLDKTLIMAILNATPDSFSDGGKYDSPDSALRRANLFISEGADIIDIGGESTRPNSERVSIEEEKRRVLPIIEAIAKRFEIPISIDTSKSEVAEAALNAGASIINDISGLRFDEKIAEAAARLGSGIVLMHSLGDFERMHQSRIEGDIIREVSRGFKESIKKAKAFGIDGRHIALDIGIGFSKSFEQNLELLAKLDTLCRDFPDYPMLAGTSRKSFIGKILDQPDASRRLSGSLATISLAIWKGAKIVRVHDVKESADAAKTIEAIRLFAS